MTAHERELLYLLANGSVIKPWAPHLKIMQCKNLLVNWETLQVMQKAGVISENLTLTELGRNTISALPQKSGLFQVKLQYATFGIVVHDDKVVEAAPIGGWMVGKSIITVETWVKRRHGTIEFVSEQEVIG